MEGRGQANRGGGGGRGGGRIAWQSGNPYNNRGGANGQGRPQDNKGGRSGRGGRGSGGGGRGDMLHREALL